MNSKYVLGVALPKVLRRLTAVRVDKQAAKTEWGKGSDKALQLLKEVGLTTFTSKDGITATITPVNEKRFDEQGFLDHLTDAQVAACTRLRVDKDLLAQAVADGVIDGEKVDAFSETFTKGEKITLTISKAVD